MSCPQLCVAQLREKGLPRERQECLLCAELGTQVLLLSRNLTISIIILLLFFLL